MIKIAFIFDFERATEVGEDVTSEFGEDVAIEFRPISAIVAGPSTTTWCYPNCREVHVTFRDDMAAIEWMIGEEMSSDEIDFHFTQQV